jgi:mannosyltransferase OCH1-like enzyme
MQDQDSARLPLIQYWHSDAMPDRIAGLIESFRRLNPDLRHLVFNERSAAAFIGEHYDSRQLRAFRSCAVPAMQADYLRCCAALALGGVYCDAYWQCIARMQPLIPPPGNGRLFQAEKGNIISGIFAFGAPGHAFLELVLEIANCEHRASLLR